jgi:hypothetical protein
MIVWWLDLQLPVQSMPITTKVGNSNTAHGEVYSIQLYVIKFVSGFLPGTQVSSTNKTDHHDITEILLKVALNTISIFSLFLSKNCVQKIFYEILVCTIFLWIFFKAFHKIKSLKETPILFMEQ